MIKEITVKLVKDKKSIEKNFVPLAKLRVNDLIDKYGKFEKILKEERPLAYYRLNNLEYYKRSDFEAVLYLCKEEGNDEGLVAVFNKKGATYSHILFFLASKKDTYSRDTIYASRIHTRPGNRHRCLSYAVGLAMVEFLRNFNQIISENKKKIKNPEFKWIFGVKEFYYKGRRWAMGYYWANRFFGDEKFEGTISDVIETVDKRWDANKREVPVNY